MTEQELTALIIDDDIGKKDLIVEILQINGVRTESVTTTREGLDLLEQRVYDLVFTDLNQEPDGTEVYRNASSKGMSVYIVTGGGKPELISKAERVAGNNLIIDSLVDKITRAAEQAKQRKVNETKYNST